MELIIKSTGVCNFNCTFCSAANMDILHSPNKAHEKIKEVISKLEPSNIIFTGGDPLCVNPEYYYDLHESFPCGMSATTNMKDFYLHPEKWAPLLSEPWFNVATSFQYGDGRRWDKDTVYDEDMFIKVAEKYREYTGKPSPPFISVIDETNEDRYLDHVLLAKRLGTYVRLNNMLAVGRQDKTYPRYKIFKIYIDIIDRGLESYESNCLERTLSKCPRNVSFSCVKNIRCCFVDNAGNLHASICDDLAALGYELTTEDDILGNIPNSTLNPNEFINSDCACCELCRLCNACNINRIIAKKDPIYCTEMKKLEDDIIRTGWLL